MSKTVAAHVTAKHVQAAPTIEFPGRRTMRTGIKQLKKEKIGADEVAVCDEATAALIYDALFRKAGTNVDAGPLSTVSADHRASAWLRTMQYFIKNGTSDKAAPGLKATYRVYVDDKDDNRIVVNANDVRELILKFRVTVRAYWRAYAREAIELCKENPAWGSSLMIKWGVPIERYYLAADFLDRIKYDDIIALGLTNDDLLTINNTTYSNTQRSAMRDADKLTSNSSIFNPGRRVTNVSNKQTT